MLTRTVFNQLPLEVLLEIFSYLSPENIAKAAQVNKTLNTLAHDNLLWKVKLYQHFPHVFNRLKVTNDHNWYQEFRTTYNKDYKKLSVSVRKIFSLVKENDLQSLRDITLSIDIFDAKDEHGISILQLAKQMDNQPALDYFYDLAKKEFQKNDYTIDTKKTDFLSRTILYWAIVCYQNLEQISLLINQGSQFDEKYSSLAFLPIHIAVQHNRLDVVQAIIKHDPQSFKQVDRFGQTPLIWAASKGHLAIVQYLLSIEGISLTYRSTITVQSSIQYNGYDALSWAATNGHSEVVMALIKADADVTLNIGFPTYFQPIHLAAREGKLKVVQILIEHKPELINQCDSNGQTPLILAAGKGHLSIVDYLLSKNTINLNAICYFTDNCVINGSTALQRAASIDHVQIVKSLIKSGADITLPIKDMPYQFIHLAVRNGSRKVVQFLIENNPELLNQVDSFGQTPLIWAISKEHLSIVDDLLSRKEVNLNARAEFPYKHPDYGLTGLTALHLAANKGYNNIVDTIIFKSVRQNIKLNFSKPVNKTKLTKQIIAKIELLTYINQINKQLKYTISFPLFQYDIDFVPSKQKNLAAAQALKEVFIKGADKNILSLYQDELNSDELKAIYHDLIPLALTPLDFTHSELKNSPEHYLLNF